MILITQNDFTERTGQDLASDFRECGITNDRLADARILGWEKYVYKTASRFRNCINDNLNQNQIECVKDAVVNYGLTCLMKGELHIMGESKDLTDATNEIISTLKQYGIIRNGFKGRC